MDSPIRHPITNRISHWSVSAPVLDEAGAETLDDCGEVVRETRTYESLAQLALERGLSQCTLRHIVANTVTGKSIKARRYRCLIITKIRNTPGKTAADRLRDRITADALETEITA